MTSCRILLGQWKLICFVLFTTNSIIPVKGGSFPRRWGAKRPTKLAITNTTESSSSSNFTIPEWQKQLPDPLCRRRTLRRVVLPLSTSTSMTVYLLGTSHVSNDSSADVSVLLKSTAPDVVFLELCDQRIPMLAPKQQDNFDQNSTFWDKVRLVQQGSGMSKASAMSTVMLTQVQDDYAESLGVELGGEFRVAYEHCLQHKPTLVLGDRPLQITLLRAWESLRLWGKFKCMCALIISSLIKPSPQELRDWMQSILEGDSDVLTESMSQLRQSFPSLARVILEERDAYLACKIYQTSRYLNRSQNHTMVAVVGAGHGPGICQWLTDGNGQTPEQVLRDILITKKHSNAQYTEYLVTNVAQLPYEGINVT